MIFSVSYVAEIQTHPQWTTVQQQCFVLKVICPRCQRKSDVSHISLPSIALSGSPLSMLHPTSNPMEQEWGLLMDVEGCSGPTAINSSLQEAACQVDGISPLPLPVTQSRRGRRQMLHLCVCFTVLPTVKSWHKRVDWKSWSSPELVSDSQWQCDGEGHWDYREWNWKRLKIVIWCEGYNRDIASLIWQHRWSSNISLEEQLKWSNKLFQ